MKRFIFLLFCFFGAHTFAQPVWLLHKSYGAKYYFVDSFLNFYSYKNPTPGLGQITGWETWARNNKDPELEGELTLLEYKLMMRHIRAGNKDLENKLLELAEFARGNNLLYLEADVLHVIGNYYWEIERNYILAVEKYLTSYTIYKNFSAADFPAKHEYLYGLGLTYYQYDDLENSLKYLRIALNTPPSKKRDINYAVPNTIGLSFRKLKMYDSALLYFREIYDSALKYNDRQWMGITSGNIGITYYYQKKYDEAIPLLEEDIETGKGHEVKNSAKSMAILASIYYFQNKIDKSEQLLKEALSMCEVKSFWPDYLLAEQIYTQLYKVYAAKNNMRLAYLYADSALVAKDSVFASNNVLNLAKAQERADYLQHELEGEKLQSLKKIQAFERNWLWAGIFLALVIGFLIINRQRLKRKKLMVEKKHAESELTAASVKLDSFREIDIQKKLVEEKNRELSQSIKDLEEAQSQLIQAEKMASLGQLTAGIAHEINNPVNFVSASIDPLRNDLRDIMDVIDHYEMAVKENALEAQFATVEKFKQEINIEFSKKETAELLKGIEEGAQRTANIVKGLRNFSRLDTNTFRLANLNEGLESTLTILYPAYKNKVTIVRDYGDIPEVTCIQGQINQVFMNILSNAIQAIGGEGKIFIKTILNDNFVKVSIRDNGGGMSKETISKIFDPFFTTKDVGKGTGLGLSISFGIIEKHKGKIEVFSELNKGTEFVITIPVSQETI